MAIIHVQTKTTAVEINFGKGKHSLLFERSSDGGVMVTQVTEKGTAEVLGAMDEVDFETLKNELVKL